MQGWVKIGSLQNTKLELGRATAQRVILLLPNLIDDIHFAICIGLIQSHLRLTSHSVTIDTSGRHLTLSAHRRRLLLVYSYMLCMYKPFLTIMQLVVIPTLPGRASLISPYFSKVGQTVFLSK